jgi:hypothetical protein
MTSQVCEQGRSMADMYYVKCGDQPVGTSRLEHADPSMGIAFGRFYPLPAYESVRPVFLLFTQALGVTRAQTDRMRLDQYYQARDALHLTIETADGRVVPTTAIHVVDWGPSENDEPLELEIQTSDAAIWRAQ